MKLNAALRNIILVIIVLANIGCDQVTKNIARKKIVPGESISVVDPYFTLTNVENSGAFLSLGDSLPKPIKILLLSILPLLVMAMAVYFIITQRGASHIAIIGLGCIIGGGLGNLYDRILFGSVTDFMHINAVVFQTGIFNMADVSIMVGMGLLILNEYNKRKSVILTTREQ
jgi:signal peptidase II